MVLKIQTENGDVNALLVQDFLDMMDDVQRQMIEFKDGEMLVPSDFPHMWLHMRKLLKKIQLNERRQKIR